MTPTQRTLQALRKMGHLAAVVEKWNAHAKVRQDLFGFIDIVAVTEHETIGIQCTSGSNLAGRRKKILDLHDKPQAWLRAGNLIELWGWRKLKVKRGGTAIRWEPRVERITLEDWQ